MVLETMGVAIPIDPITGLRTAIWEAWGNVTFLRHQCQQLGLELIGDVWSSTRDGDLFVTHQDVLPMVQLYGEWFDRFRKVCVEAAKIGLAEAEIQLARQQADIVARVVLGVIDGLNLPPKKVEQARRLFGAEFRKVAPSLNTVELS